MLEKIFKIFQKIWKNLYCSFRFVSTSFHNFPSNLDIWHTKNQFFLSHTIEYSVQIARILKPLFSQWNFLPAGKVLSPRKIWVFQVMIKTPTISQISNSWSSSNNELVMVTELLVFQWDFSPPPHFTLHLLILLPTSKLVELLWYLLQTPV